MQVFISLSDSMCLDVAVTITSCTLVEDLLQIVSSEWDLDSDFLELFYEGNLLPSETLLLSHGLESDSHLIASQVSVFKKKLLTNSSKRNKISQLKLRDRHLRLDTPAFVDDGCVEFKSEWLPSGIEQLSFSNDCFIVTQVADYFLSESCITKLSLSQLSHVMNIGKSFMSECKSLQEVDLTGLRNIINVEDDFLSGCASMEFLDLSGFQQVIALNSKFLNCCESLKKIVGFPALENVKHIGAYFLYGCSSLGHVDVSIFKKLLTVGSNFLAFCSSLKTVDLPDFSRVTIIESLLLYKCSELISVSFIGMENIVNIENGFLGRCLSLKTVSLSGLKSVTSVGSYFMEGCESLQSISDFSSLESVETIGNEFLDGCSLLQSVDLSVLKSLVRVGSGFLSKCISLKNVDLQSFKNVQHIGDLFLAVCTSLLTITNIKSLKHLVRINKGFLFGCKSLQAIDTAHFVRLRLVGPRFLEGCVSLKNIDLVGFQNTKIIGEGFLERCRGLQSINVSYLEKVTKIGKDLQNCYCFLRGCNNIIIQHIDKLPLSHIVRQAIDETVLKST